MPMLSVCRWELMLTRWRFKMASEEMRNLLRQVWELKQKLKKSEKEKLDLQAQVNILMRRQMDAAMNQRDE